MRKIGIMGGTFNPIHIGHLMLSEWAMDAVGLDEIWIIPAGQPYKKAEETILPGQERLHMAELAVRENKRISCLDLEIERKGYTYTYETQSFTLSWELTAFFLWKNGENLKEF